MKCPRCDSGVLDERERNGVVVDVCTSCRGVWLDRGELEKLLAYTKRELDEERAYYRGNEQAPPSSDRRPGYGHDHGRAPDNRDPRYGDSRHGHRKKSWLENLGDIFD